MKKSTEELSLLTEQEIVSIAERCGLLTFVTDAGYKNDALWFDADCTDFARAIESNVIEKIKAQGAVVFIAPNVAAFHGIGRHSAGVHPKVALQNNDDRRNRIPPSATQ